MTLGQANFRFHADDFSKADVEKESSALASSVRLGVKILAKIGDAVPSLFELNPVFNKEGVQRELSNIHQFATLTCFKYVLTQPVIAATVEGDAFNEQTFLEITQKFDKIILNFLEFTGRLGAQQLSAAGILMFVFFKQGQADHFVATAQKQCKIIHFWKKTCVLPWVIDVPEGRVIKHPGLLPFLPGVLGVKEVATGVFGM